MLRGLIIAIAAASTVVPASSAAASGPHWCRQGDPPLYASARTECGLAGSITTAYVDACQESRRCRLSVRAPSSSERYRISCRRTGSRHTGTVYCRSWAISSIWTRFSAEV